MSPRTKSNLLTALDCDALNAAKYARFAARARKDDDWPLAQVFQDAAESARTEHFARQACLEALICNSPENLRDSIEAERSQIRLYEQFAREAEIDGDVCAASAFEQIVSDKRERLARFQQLLGNTGLLCDFQVVER